MIQEALAFDDVLLVPKHSEIKSRKDIDIGNKLGKLHFSLPIISSPMDTVTESDMALAMSRQGGLGIIHRYNGILEQSTQVLGVTCMSDKPHIVGAAIGVTGDYLERSQELLKIGANIICIDVAHGDHILVKEAIEVLEKHTDRSKYHLMAGNVATGDGFIRLAEWGVDSIRVGIGGGSICSTRLNTGFGVPNLAAIFDCVNTWPLRKITRQNKPALIIDGGVRNAGDIVKALAAGADFVKCGSLLAGTDESPGEIITQHGYDFKVYRGMASFEAQNDFKGTSSAPEGISTTIPYKGLVKPILERLAGNIQSGFSYAGARNIVELRKNAQFIKQTHAGQHESFTHILSK